MDEVRKRWDLCRSPRGRKGGVGEREEVRVMWKSCRSQGAVLNGGRKEDGKEEEQDRMEGVRRGGREGVEVVEEGRKDGSPAEVKEK